MDQLFKMRGTIMRKLLHTSAAVAAQLTLLMAANAADVGVRPQPYTPPPAYVPPPFSWTGFYLGGNIGGAWANHDVTDTFLGVNFNNGNSRVQLASQQHCSRT